MARVPRQSSLGEVRIVQHPVPDGMKIGRVTDTSEYDTYGRINVIYLREKGAPTPIWVVENGAARKPVVGDFVLVGFLDNQANNPYFAGFYKAMAFTSNFIYMDDTMLRVQYPTQESDVYDSSLPLPEGPHLTNDANLPTRIYIQMHPTEGLILHVPTGLPCKFISDSVQFIDASDGTTVRQTI